MRADRESSRRPRKSPLSIRPGEPAALAQQLIPEAVSWRPRWDSRGTKGRDIYIAFDSDAHTNLNVFRGQKRVSDETSREGPAALRARARGPDTRSLRRSFSAPESRSWFPRARSRSCRCSRRVRRFSRRVGDIEELRLRHFEPCVRLGGNHWQRTPDDAGVNPFRARALALSSVLARVTLGISTGRVDSFAVGQASGPFLPDREPLHSHDHD
jgi:hypothetical protein